jgi:hypothetical protein
LFGGIAVLAVLVGLPSVTSPRRDPGGGPTATTTPGTTATTTPGTSTAIASATPVATEAGAATVTGFGATNEAWEANHTPDTRFEPGCCYDPTPGLGPDDRHNAKYHAVLRDDHGIYGYSMRLPKGTSIDEVTPAALAEMPADAKVLWNKRLDGCVMVGIGSETLGPGQAIFTFYTSTAEIDPVLDPNDIRESINLFDPGSKEPPEIGC